MEFFIPFATSAEQRDTVYSALKASLANELGAQCSDRRVRTLKWWHDGRQHEAIVGEVTSFNGETVIAILYEPARRLYHVCTPNRGVAGGGPILAGEHFVTWHEDFTAPAV